MVAPRFLHLFGGHVSASWDVCAVGYKPNGSTCTRGVTGVTVGSGRGWD